MVKIKVPATSANLGPGFDCLGMALEIYNIVEVEEIEKGIEIIVPESDKPFIECNENNLIYQAMLKVFKKAGYPYKGIRIRQTNDIPMTRGLGSSAACIVSGIAAANKICGEKLSMEDMINLATEMDGHPDNVLPALIGGITIACTEKGKVYYSRINPPSAMTLAVMIPDFQLSTKIARSILPGKVSMKDAVYNVSRAALMVASLLTGELDNLIAASQDCLHQPYRKKLILDWDKVQSIAKELGAKAVFLSGAGPAMIAILESNGEVFQREMAARSFDFKEKWEVRITDICGQGVQELPGSRITLA